MAQDGKFPEEWSAELGVTMATIYRWANEYPEFDEAVLISWHLLHAYWARYARENLNNPDLKAGLLMEMLRKRFPSTWGKDPQNTQTHFEARNKAQAGDQPLLDPSEVRTASDEAINDAIAKLEERRRIMREG